MAESLLRIESLCACIDLSSSAIYDRLNPDSPRFDPTFPKPVKVGSQSVAWLQSEVDAWIMSRVAERDAMLADDAKRTEAKTQRKARAARLTTVAARLKEAGHGCAGSLHGRG